MDLPRDVNWKEYMERVAKLGLNNQEAAIALFSAVGTQMMLTILVAFHNLDRFQDEVKV